MKIVKLEISAAQKKELEELQSNGSGIMRERSLAVLHCAAGRKITWIAKALNRQILTIRTWIERFRQDGVQGLERSYSPGRPSIRNRIFRPKVEEYLNSTPKNYGWREECWTMVLLREQLKKDIGKNIGISTLERLLKDCGYSYKRPRKGVPVTSPSKEEKLKRVKAIAQQILELKEDSNPDILFVDESHFSTEPYVIRGWHRRGEDFFLETSRNRQSISIFGAYRPRTKSFYWKSATKSDKLAFKNFLHQLIAQCQGRKTVVILDNASIHICKYIKDFVNRNPNIEIFTLPTYSPEYNPTEQVWRWLKPQVCGLPKAINGGCQEIVSRIRKIIRAWTFGQLAKTPQIGIGIWQNLLFNYL